MSEAARSLERCPRLLHPLITARHLALSIIIYLRQSSMGQVRDNWGSTNIQQEQRQLALDYGWLPEQIIVIDDDLGKSGSTTVGRTGWDEVLRLIATGSVGAVMVLNVARLARQLINCEELRILAKYNGAVLILDGRVVDPANPADTALFQVQASFAQLDNDSRTKHLRDTRLAKARAGATVSKLPIGWRRRADGTFEFDPIVKPVIDEVYVVYRQVRSIRGTVAELRRLGRELPARLRGKVEWKPPSLEKVRRFIVNVAYAGVYVYGTSDTRPEYGLDAHGKPRRRKLPEAQWIRHENYFPAYITLAEQQSFREYREANRFSKRNRPNKGAAVCQGLLKCANCGETLTVCYARRGSDRYQCTMRSVQYAEAPCFSIAGKEFDAAIEREFLKRLGNPLAEVCQLALAELRSTEGTRASRVDAERQRLEYTERIARDRYEQVDPRNRLLAARLEVDCEAAMSARETFERQLAVQPSGPALDALEQEFHELHGSIQDIPALWHHPVVTDRDRQAMLQCLIDHVVVQRTAVAIEANIHWVDGATSELKLWHLMGVRELVRQFHAEGLTAKQIRQRLIEGDPATGQKWEYTVTHIFQILKRLGLPPNSRRTAMKKIRAEIDALYGRGLTVWAIVKHLNDADYKTSRGHRWSAGAVGHWLTRQNRRDAFEESHRELLAEAKSRGLTNAQTGEEFNQRGIARAGGEPWTADVVRQRRKHLKRRLRTKS